MYKYIVYTYTLNKQNKINNIKKPIQTTALQERMMTGVLERMHSVTNRVFRMAH